MNSGAWNTLQETTLDMLAATCAEAKPEVRNWLQAWLSGWLPAPLEVGAIMLNPATASVEVETTFGPDVSILLYRPAVKQLLARLT